jgi:hypothetical protein
MIEAPPHPSARPVRPRRVREQPSLSYRTMRPSLLDLRFRGDAWIVASGEGTLALCLGTYQLTNFRGLPLDLPSLNQLLDRVRNRRQRPDPVVGK